jgi:tRNA threonylcarbamoyl adenosine modification protein YjeE
MTYIDKHMQRTTQTIEDFEQAAGEILQIISDEYSKKGTDNAYVVCLHGDLGAGKTTMTQIIGKSFGVIETINSPTFVIKKTYQTTDNVFKTLIHMDAYRLEGEQNLDIFRLDQDFTSTNTLMIIEWPEIIESVIPKHAMHIFIEHDGEGRKITFKKTAHFPK